MFAHRHATEQAGPHRATTPRDHFEDVHRPLAWMTREACKPDAEASSFSSDTPPERGLCVSRSKRTI